LGQYTSFSMEAVLLKDVAVLALHVEFIFGKDPLSHGYFSC